MNTTTTGTDVARCTDAGEHLISSRHRLAECVFAPTEAEREAAAYERAIRLIKASVEELNTLLGHKPGEGISFGYIGNIPVGAAQGSQHDDRAFYVFLPHPGRVGTYDDRIGGFSYGNAQGAGTVCAQTHAMVLLARNLHSRFA